MKRVGLQNVYYLPNGFAIGTLPANDPSLTLKIGFISQWTLLILMPKESIHR